MQVKINYKLSRDKITAKKPLKFLVDGTTINSLNKETGDSYFECTFSDNKHMIENEDETTQLGAVTMIVHGTEAHTIGLTDVNEIAREIEAMGATEIVDDLNSNLVDRKFIPTTERFVVHHVSTIQRLSLELANVASDRVNDRDKLIKDLSLDIKFHECQIISLIQSDYQVSLKSLPYLKLLKPMSLVSGLFAAVNLA